MQQVHRASHRSISRQDEQSHARETKPMPVMMQPLGRCPAGRSQETRGTHRGIVAISSAANPGGTRYAHTPAYRGRAQRTGFR
jgi:hypothetical protein